MSSSVWNPIPTSAAGDPAAMLNSQLANALSTMGDAHYWEESISPTTIRTSLASSDPSNPNSTPTLLRGMKWLLASISKGRNVADFYPHVVKLVGASSLEVRKMVYMYLEQYSDHDATTRELSLLSINSFQRGLTDPEQLIRALALRVLTSIRVADILQIQILGVQKCASDMSPYVRKCAANALAKLYQQCCTDQQQQKMLLDIMQKLLNTEISTMVLTSAVISFAELCPERLEFLHGTFRRLCNLLADMDEWGQVVIIDVLCRYCRQFFCAPQGTGSAEAIDAERRVVRTMQGVKAAASVAVTTAASPEVAAMTLPKRTGPDKIKRRVVKKGFYSDEEDGSTEEEVYSLPVATAMRQHANITINPSNKNHNDKGLEDEHLDEDHRLLLRSTLPLLKSRNSAVVLAVASLHYYCGVASIRVRSSLGKALVRIHRDRREIQYVVLTSIKTLVKECPSAFTPFLQDFYVKGIDPGFTRLIKLEILTLLALEPNSIDAVLVELRTYIRHDDDKTFCCAAIRAVGDVAELARIVHDRHGETTGNEQRERNQSNRVALNALYGLLTLTRASTDSLVVGECSIVMERILLQLASDNEGRAAVEDPNRIQESTIKRLLLLLITSLSSKSLDDNGDAKDLDDDDDDVHNKPTVRIPPLATATTLWMIGEWLAPSTHSLSVQGFDHQARLKTRLELARLIARAYPGLEPVEKLQSIHFASKLLVASASPQEAAVCELVLSMGRADVQIDVRDRARMESNLLHTSVGLQYDADNVTISVSGKTLAVDQVKKLLLSPKPPSSALPLQDDKEENGAFRFGTLSSLVNRRAKAAYLHLPKWADVNSPSSLREDAATTKLRRDDKQHDGGWNVDTTKKNASGFYDSEGGKFVPVDLFVVQGISNVIRPTEDSDSDDSDDDDSDDEAENSDWGSDDDESEEEEDDDSDETDDSEDSDDIMPRPTMSTTPQPPPVHYPAMNPQMNGGPSLLLPTKATALVDEEDDDDSSEWDDADEDSDSDDEAEPAIATSNLLGIAQHQQKPPASNLLSMTQQKPPASNLLGMTQKQRPAAPERFQSTQCNDSYSQGLEGLVMAPVVVGVEEKKVDPDIDRDSSSWFDLVRHELGGGLSVKARYLRGPTRDREAQLIGLDPSSPAVVLLQLKFQNKRTDTGVLRRVRVISRSTTSGHVAPKRSVVPPEITALAKDKMTIAILGMEFASVSDREGDLQGRFDLKSDRGSNPLDLRPPLGELLQPLAIKANAFEQGMNRLQGFQRVISTFSLPAEKMSTLDLAILKQVALRPLDKDKTWKDSRRLRLVGNLPASTDKVYIVVQCAATGCSGSFTVCCDNAIATNSMLDTLKKALK